MKIDSVKDKKKYQGKFVAFIPRKTGNKVVAEADTISELVKQQGYIKNKQAVIHKFESIKKEKKDNR